MKIEGLVDHTHTFLNACGYDMSRAEAKVLAVGVASTARAVSGRCTIMVNSDVTITVDSVTGECEFLRAQDAFSMEGAAEA